MDVPVRLEGIKLTVKFSKITRIGYNYAYYCEFPPNELTKFHKTNKHQTLFNIDEFTTLLQINNILEYDTVVMNALVSHGMYGTFRASKLELESITRNSQSVAVSYTTIDDTQ